MENEMGLFETRDLFQVAFLLLHDIEPEKTLRVGRVVYALYERTEDLTNAVELWKDPAVMVPASRYAGAHRQAKRLLLDSDPEKMESPERGG